MSGKTRAPVTGDRFTDLVVADDGTFEYQMRGGGTASCAFDLFLIREAWGDVDYEDLADGFGEGMGTMDGDWSGIRDSSPAARAAMLQRALNHLFPEGM